MASPQGAERQKTTNDFGHLRSEKFSFRINQIEHIRANGVGEVVALPQLVVCGDQSAGKSSVLEGITGIPFPRQEGLCTRFPTEIILRHDDSDQVKITTSIRPHASRTKEARTRLDNYHKDLQDMSELPTVIHDVSKLMNIRGYAEEGGHAFAADALRIEVSGRIGLHLSVVDLPGLISVANEEQTEEDVKAVHNMVTTYLESSRSIILAVLQASNDMANQTIIKLAKQHDPEAQRTVGIITKPDLINKGSEVKLALVAKNQDSIKLKLGFFLLKNPTPSELKEGLTMSARSQRELLFFSDPAWVRQGLDPDRIGAQKLRAFLQELLEFHIENELPKVRAELRKALNQAEAELRAMGAARSNVGDVRSFITGLSMRFYELLQAALDGHYLNADPEFFSKDQETRLRARVQKKNTEFADTIREKGMRWKVVKTPSIPNATSGSKPQTTRASTPGSNLPPRPPSPVPPVTQPQPTQYRFSAVSNGSLSNQGTLFSGSAATAAPMNKLFSVAMPQTGTPPLFSQANENPFSNLLFSANGGQLQTGPLFGSGLTGQAQPSSTSMEMAQTSTALSSSFEPPRQFQSACQDDQISISETEMIAWIKQRYYRTRGKELPGNYNSALLADLFQEQSQRWAGLVEAHVHDVLAVASDWVDRALLRIVPDVTLRGQIAVILREWLDVTKSRALGELDLLLEDEKRNPLTYNHYYTDNVQKSRLDAQRLALRNAANDILARDDTGVYLAQGITNIDAFVSRMETRINPNMDEQACKEVRNEMNAYYKVAMKTFVDNVARQVIERRIMAPLNQAFYPNSVSQLTDEALLALGSESKQQLARRQKVAALVTCLKSSLRDIQGPVPM